MRLRVSYKTPAALLHEFTRSVGQGSVVLESLKAVPVGTRFVFEMLADGVEAPVEVLGEVSSVSPTSQGKYMLTIRYNEGAGRDGLDAVLRHIFDAHRFEKMREHPRIPLQLRATEETAQAASYFIRDISQGGVGAELESAVLPKHVRVGAPFLLEVRLSIGTLALYGEVLWVSLPPAGRVRWLRPTFGGSFGKLRRDTVARLEKILELRALPPPPWHARLSFGIDAVSRMP